MTWLINVVNDLQKRILEGTEESPDNDAVIDRLRENHTNERVRQFQDRLMALDRRLAALR
jgi:hypothetical protein